MAITIPSGFPDASNTGVPAGTGLSPHIMARFVSPRTALLSVGLRYMATLSIEADTSLSRTAKSLQMAPTTP